MAPHTAACLLSPVGGPSGPGQVAALALPLLQDVGGEGGGRVTVCPEHLLGTQKQADPSWPRSAFASRS